jgi:hypothetical protein
MLTNLIIAGILTVQPLVVQLSLWDVFLFIQHEFTNFLIAYCLHSQHSCHSSLFFCDGLRSVDFVLVWDDLLKHSNLEASEEKRKVFEKNLQCEG